MILDDCVNVQRLGCTAVQYAGYYMQYDYVHVQHLGHRSAIRTMIVYMSNTWATQDCNMQVCVAGQDRSACTVS